MRGFTLVELITVIALLAILTLGTSRFLTDASSGYATTVARSELATTAQLSVQRMTRSFRDALPNSVRVSGNCIEFVPIFAATSYLQAPFDSPTTTMTLAPFAPHSTPNPQYIAIFPDDDVYTPGSTAAISPEVTLSVPDVNNVVNGTFSLAHQFTNQSPQERAYLVSDPETFCLDGTDLWHYQGYGFSDAQLQPVGLPNNMPGRGLMAEHVTAATPFAHTEPTLMRNGTVTLDLTFSSQGDDVYINHVVHLRNVP